MINHEKIRTEASVLTLVFSCILCTITAFAYEPITEIELSYTPNPDSVYIINVTRPDKYVNFSIDNTFTDTEGNVYEISGANRILCDYDYVDSYLGDHTRNADGSCSTIVYNAQRCIRCGHIKQKTYVNTITCAICPHNV